MINDDLEQLGNDFPQLKETYNEQRETTTQDAETETDDPERQFFQNNADSDSEPDSLWAEYIVIKIFTFELFFLNRNPEFALINNLNGKGNNRPPTGEKPLYQYSNHVPITLNKAMHLLQFARQKHKMTDSCFECLLQMLSNGGLLPESNFLPATIRTFQKSINLKSSIRPTMETAKFVIFDFVEQLKCIVSSRLSILPVIKLSP